MVSHKAGEGGANRTRREKKEKVIKNKKIKEEKKECAFLVRKLSRVDEHEARIRRYWVLKICQSNRFTVHHAWVVRLPRVPGDNLSLNGIPIP